ncbi:putative protein kinase RLK-Pelle-LRR-III family [Helianthus annuus]|nr:putative protein kinase RLK-Pelle-LRR-III family [Helianthus annuus]KAJ0820394.1 putative protein kinase RLK-Pelle-LRR-III family [Helianthus annuus]KAJ0835002.1 putative protein kinase RLK-Pelle-LRR-III family [Helianthus annuus]
MITTSPFLHSILFFSILLFLPSISALNLEGITLLSFKHSLSHQPSLLQNWNQSDPTPCSWSGVTCSPKPGPVTGLSLPNSHLSGSIPIELARLKRLRVLNLSNNSLNGTLPISVFTAFRSLRVLNLSNNYLTGGIPAGFDSVNVLDLSSNSFSGALPLLFGGESLNYLNLSHNKLSGSVFPEFAEQIPANAVVDLSFNSFTGEIPHSLSNQKTEYFAGNADLCGKPLMKTCTVPSTHSFPPNVTLDSFATPAIAAIPKYVGEPDKQSGRKVNSWKIVAIVVGDVAAVVILVVVFFHAYQFRKKRKMNQNPKEFVAVGFDESRACSCFGCGTVEESSDTETLSESVGFEPVKNDQENKCLVMVDGETELEMETLLKASAYILGSSGGSIVYKAVVGGDAGVAFAVRRLAECRVEKMKDFEKIVRAMGKLRHRNLVKVRGFYWGEEEKLVIYDYVSGGNLAGAAYEKVGSSSCHTLSFEVRLKIAKGIAKGLSYIHEKKHVHGNMNPNNILLTSEMDPVISDFGLEWLISGKTNYACDKSRNDTIMCRDHLHRHHYQAPESLKTFKSNPKWDVYAFGIILLELFSGKGFSDKELAMWNTNLTIADMETNILRVTDQFITSMDMHGTKDSILRCFELGFSCASLVPHKRPSMKEALHVLEKIPSPS